MPLSDLDWLRLVLEDNPTQEIEALTGDGTSRTFSLANPPPLAGTLQVALDGIEQDEGVAYTVPADAPGIVRFTDPPAAGLHVVFSYSRQLFTDAELTLYLEAAALDWDAASQRVGRVYRAAVLALDALLTGAATALSFGAGAEQFDLASVFERIMRQRASLAAMLTGEAARPRVFEPVEPEPVVLVMAP